MNIEWVEPYRKELVRHVTSIVGDTDAEDVVQDACVGMLELPEDLRTRIPAAKERAWLYRVVTRYALMSLRDQSAKRALKVESLDDMLRSHAQYIDYGAPDGLIDHADPETLMILREQVDRAKSSLSPAEQATFEAMLAHDPTDFAGIAEDLKVNIRTAQNRVYAVRRKVAGLFAE